MRAHSFASEPPECSSGWSDEQIPDRQREMHDFMKIEKRCWNRTIAVLCKIKHTHIHTHIYMHTRFKKRRGSALLTLRSMKFTAVSFSVFKFRSTISMFTLSRIRPHCMRKLISPGTFSTGSSSVGFVAMLIAFRVGACVHAVRFAAGSQACTFFLVGFWRIRKLDGRLMHSLQQKIHERRSVLEAVSAAVNSNYIRPLFLLKLD